MVFDTLWYYQAITQTNFDASLINPTTHLNAFFHWKYSWNQSVNIFEKQIFRKWMSPVCETKEQSSCYHGSSNRQDIWHVNSMWPETVDTLTQCGLMISYVILIHKLRLPWQIQHQVIAWNNYDFSWTLTVKCFQSGNSFVNAKMITYCKLYLQMLNRWLRAWLSLLQCISNGLTPILCRAPKIVKLLLQPVTMKLFDTSHMTLMIDHLLSKTTSERWSFKRGSTVPAFKRILFPWCHWDKNILDRPVSQIPQCTCSISHNAPFRTEMCTFLFRMVHCGIWNRCIMGCVN